ncbi:hypothetical protein CDD83_10548 [Cordyceps sp. RAO-2017]|nr:hypothetical protein CDD83_10548 [Cordyceps sp. RAO-2017]
MAAPSTFSYAQAAKGQGAPSTLSAIPNQSAAQAPGPQSSAAANKTASPPEGPNEPSDVSRPAEPRSSMIERQDADSTNGSESDLRSESAAERRPNSKRDDDAAGLERPWTRAERGTRSSSSTARSVDESDPRKPRKSNNGNTSTNKKPRVSDQQAGEQVAAAPEAEPTPAPEPPKVELSEAPIPSVNIWQQRKEAQLAKAKPAPAPAEDKVNGALAHVDEPSKVASPDQDPSSPVRDATSVNGAKTFGKPGETARPERNGSRGSRSTEREAKDGRVDLPPSVEDAASWPTPETAIKEDKRKSISAQADRQDREPKEGQDEGSQAKPRQKGKWVTYDYVPSVSFETQIPQLRTTKPRGGARGVNGTRTSLGGPTGGDKPAPPTQAGKFGDPKDRPREAGTAPDGAVSIPPSAKRASMDASGSKEQRKVPGQAMSDRTRDTVSQFAEHGQGARDRPEGRGDRGRGGYRSRGGHHSISTHPQHQAASAGYVPGPIPSRSQGPYSPPPRQGGHGQMFMAHSGRGGRGRNGAGPNFHRMSLPNGSTRLPPVQTQFGPYEYPMAPLSAMPFQPQPPYWDHVVLSMLRNQLEYYFSIENLCKDTFLRKKMDSQGFVKLDFVASFKRIRDLTSDMSMIRAVCESSTEIDYVVDNEDVERLRRRVGWQTWVMPVPKRDEEARTEGPAHITFKNRPFPLGTQYGAMTAYPLGVSPSMGYLPGDSQFPQFPDGQGLNGAFNGGGVSHGGGPSQLSADVPDFSPSGAAVAAGGLTGNSSLVAGNPSAGAEVVANGTHVEAPAVLGQANGHVDESGDNATSSGIDSEGPSGHDATQS